MGAAINPRMMPALSTVSPTGTSNRSMISGVHDRQPDKTPYHRRDGSQQFDQDLEVLPCLARGKFADIDRGPQGEGNGNQHGKTRYAGGSRHQGQDAVGGFVLVRGLPPWGREKLSKAEVPQQKSHPFLCDEHEDSDDEENGRDAGEQNDELHRLVDVPVFITLVESRRLIRHCGVILGHLRMPLRRAAAPSAVLPAVPDRDRAGPSLPDSQHPPRAPRPTAAPRCGMGSMRSNSRWGPAG